VSGQELRVVDCGGAGALIALALAKCGFRYPVVLEETDRQALSAMPEPLMVDLLGHQEQTLIENLIVKEWDHCFEISASGVKRVQRLVALLSLEQLAIELDEQPGGMIRIAAPKDGCRRGSPLIELRVAPGVSNDRGWVHSTLWELNRDHELTAPVIADHTLSAEGVFQYFPLAARLLQVREISSSVHPLLREAVVGRGTARLIRTTTRQRLDVRSWRWSPAGLKPEVLAPITPDRALCDLLPATLPLVEAIQRLSLPARKQVAQR
jgi:hypothetical protein